MLEYLLACTRPWSIQEIGRHLDNEIAAKDSVARLHGQGLVHLQAGFAFPTRAARRAAQLELGVTGEDVA